AAQVRAGVRHQSFTPTRPVPTVTGELRHGASLLVPGLAAYVRRAPSPLDLTPLYPEPRRSHTGPRTVSFPSAAGAAPRGAGNGDVGEGEQPHGVAGRAQDRVVHAPVAL